MKAGCDVIHLKCDANVADKCRNVMRNNQLCRTKETISTPKKREYRCGLLSKKTYFSLLEVVITTVHKADARSRKQPTVVIFWSGIREECVQGVLLVTDWVCYCWQTDYTQRSEQGAVMHQYTTVKERERWSGRKKIERGREGGRSAPDHPFSCIREEGYPSSPSSQHRDLLSAVSPSYCRLGHDIWYLRWKSTRAGIHCCYRTMPHTYIKHLTNGTRPPHFNYINDFICCMNKIRRWSYIFTLWLSHILGLRPLSHTNCSCLFSKIIMQCLSLLQEECVVILTPVETAFKSAESPLLGH